MRNKNDWKSLLRFLGIMLFAEGFLMALCTIPALHFHDGTATPILHAAAFTVAVGVFLWYSYRRDTHIVDRRMSYLLVVVLWSALALFATLPFLVTGSTTHSFTHSQIHAFSAAWFEAMSGVTSCGATVFPDVDDLPASILLWRSMTQWFGGFGIVLLVLALSPRLGINKYSLYTAEASGADNSGHAPLRTIATVRRTLGVYLSLTLVFIILLWLSGMQMWDAVNLTFTNISSGGFSVNSDSIASITHLQQYILAAAMLFSGVNFSLLYLLLTLRWRQVRHKLDQFRFYITLLLLSIGLVTAALHWHSSLPWNDALRYATVQTTSALTTTGSVVADYTIWWTPITFLLLILSLCGGMAGSTSGGLKIMRVIILLRNARGTLRDRLHPNVVNPVRLNGNPVSSHIRGNVMVIFIIFGLTLMLGIMGLMLCGVNANEAIGASVGCLTGYGPGLDASGGFGSYTHFSPSALWICSLQMLLGRLECMTVLIIFLPGFWRR